ncbi:nuclear transport factor 2 family protein [Streptomyces sioyaensis]|uniref:nuclear transport factor 2 family protein n=1 Tax=Streptomyces sioyaensis TaxID=67364 RepID=UPI00368AB655
MSDSPDAISERNAEVVRRYLRVFETQDVDELAELVADDVLVHGAGQHVRGRRYPEGSVRTPGLSNSTPSPVTFAPSRPRSPVPYDASAIWCRRWS